MRMARATVGVDTDRSVISVEAEVTVIIPAFDARRFIGASVASAIGERPARIVVVDDGSSDDTAELARMSAADSDVPLDVVTIPHGGEAAARNAGLHAATTDWVAFLDADDRFLPGRLAALMARVDADPGLDAVTSDAYMEVDGEIRGLCYGPDYGFVHVDQQAAILQQNFVFGHVVARRRRLIDLGGFDESISHTTDWAMWIDLVLSGGRIDCVPEPLSVYRVHAQSASADQVRMAEGMVASLRHAQRNPHVTPRLRTVLADSLASAENMVQAKRLNVALESGDDVRAAAAVVHSNPTQPRMRRLKARVAATFPGLSTVWKQRSRRGLTTGTAGWSIPVPADGRVADGQEFTAPLVSVVVAFLDEERFLAGAIETVREQTMSDWELILVDDGSTDGSSAIANDAAGCDERITVVRHRGGRNQGLAASRNLGLQHARSGAIAFLDADDRWEPDKLELQLRALADHPAVGMVAGTTRHRFLDRDLPDEIHPVASFGNAVLPTARFARELLRERIPVPPPPSSVLYRAAALVEAGGVPAGNSTYEDQRTFVMTSLVAPTAVIDSVVTTYARRADSLYGRLADDNVTKSRERREFEWWALRSLGRTARRHPRALVLATWLVAHRLRVAVSRRITRPLPRHSEQERTNP